MSDLDNPVLTDFGEAAVAGLSASPKVIPARYLYDRRGSELFEDITRLPEYYPTRTETALLKSHAREIAHRAGMGRTVVEFGAGSSIKTPLLLEATKAPIYVPIDISGAFLRDSSATLARAHPDIRVQPVEGDFTRPLELPQLDSPLTGFFPGSTIGNFDHRSAVALLGSFRATLGAGARLVIGIDTRKNPRLLEAAYDDAAGVTAAFNLNLLERINRELHGNVPVAEFAHRAIWNDRLGRMEMHLEAGSDLTFQVAGQSFTMRRGETIHTENSYKYTPEEARLLARTSGWEPVAAWFDVDGRFGLHVWAATGEDLQP
jgi:dimethylhistidine N-methyltransferase